MSEKMTFYILHMLSILPFLQNEKSATEVLNNFSIMSQFSSLKINKSKCEVGSSRDWSHETGKSGTLWCRIRQFTN